MEHKFKLEGLSIVVDDSNLDDEKNKFMIQLSIAVSLKRIADKLCESPSRSARDTLYKA